MLIPIVSVHEWTKIGMTVTQQFKVCLIVRHHSWENDLFQLLNVAEMELVETWSAQ